MGTSLEPLLVQVPLYCQCTHALVVPISIPISAASFMRLVMGITSHNDCDRAIYSASVELRAISV